MEEQVIIRNLDDEKVLTLKSLEKQVNIKFAEYENKIKALERKVEVLTRATRGNYGK